MMVFWLVHGWFWLVSGCCLFGFSFVSGVFLVGVGFWLVSGCFLIGFWLFCASVLVGFWLLYNWFLVGLLLVSGASCLAWAARHTTLIQNFRRLKCQITGCHVLVLLAGFPPASFSLLSPSLPPYWVCGWFLKLFGLVSVGCLVGF